MIFNWKPSWYELDQTIVVGNTDYFYLVKDKKSFANNLINNEDIEVRGEVLKITHSELGELLEIYTIGLSYKFFLKDGKYIAVDAEQDIGQIEYPIDYKINDWNFNVEINILEVTGFSSQQRHESLLKNERLRVAKERIERYKRLLNIE